MKVSKNKTDKATAYAYRLFGIRPRSERELKQRLFGKHYDHETISGVISSLKEKDIIDDVEFARRWIESRRRTNPKGDRLLRKELREKGVSATVIDTVLAEKKESENSVVRALAGKKAESLKNLPKQKARKKLFDFLARRGFDFDVIGEAVNEAFG